MFTVYKVLSLPGFPIKDLRFERAGDIRRAHAKLCQVNKGREYFLPDAGRIHPCLWCLDRGADTPIVHSAILAANGADVLDTTMRRAHHAVTETVSPRSSEAALAVAADSAVRARDLLLRGDTSNEIKALARFDRQMATSQAGELSGQAQDALRKGHELVTAQASSALTQFEDACRRFSRFQLGHLWPDVNESKGPATLALLSHSPGNSLEQPRDSRNRSFHRLTWAATPSLPGQDNLGARELTTRLVALPKGVAQSMLGSLVADYCPMPDDLSPEAVAVLMRTVEAALADLDTEFADVVHAAIAATT